MDLERYLSGPSLQMLSKLQFDAFSTLLNGAATVHRLKAPPAWQNKSEKLKLFNRPSGFIGLINLIVEQQLSVTSAKAIFKRLKESIKPFSAKQMLKTDAQVLRDAGLSKQKISYCFGIAKACTSGTLNFSSLHKKSNEEISRRAC